MMVCCEKAIAVLLATYNGEPYLAGQLDSLLAQSFQDFNIYIHDDGSADDTVNIIRNYCERYPDRIFSLQAGSTGGAKNNFFFLMEHIDAQYYMFCDQDDFWKKEKICKSLMAIKKAENGDLAVPALAFTDLEVVDSDLRMIHSSMNRMQKLNPYHLSINKVICQNPITGCTLIINRKLREMALRYQNIENIIMHDWWIAIVAARYGKIVYCDEALIQYRQHGHNTIGAYNPNDIHYIFTKVKAISSMKQAIQKSRLQAQELCDAFGAENNPFAYEFANLDRYSKFRRICFYVNNKAWKNGLIRNIGFLVFG